MAEALCDKVDPVSGEPCFLFSNHAFRGDPLLNDYTDPSMHVASTPSGMVTWKDGERTPAPFRVDGKIPAKGPPKALPASNDPC